MDKRQRQRQRRCVVGFVRFGHIAAVGYRAGDNGRTASVCLDEQGVSPCHSRGRAGVADCCSVAGTHCQRCAAVVIATQRLIGIVQHAVRRQVGQVIPASRGGDRAGVGHGVGHREGVRAVRIQYEGAGRHARDHQVFVDKRQRQRQRRCIVGFVRFS